MRWIGRRLSYANVVASLALFLALTGGAYALMGNRFVGRGGKITMCIRSADHVPQVISPGATCPAGSTALTIDQTGKRGPRGPRGLQGKPGSSTPASYISVHAGMATTVCGGCAFSFTASNGSSGVDASTADITLANNNATFTVANAGTYLVTVAVGPAGPVELHVNGAAVGPVEAMCSGTSVCSFQRIVGLSAPMSTISVANATANSENEDIGSGMTILRIQ